MREKYFVVPKDPAEGVVALGVMYDGATVTVLGPWSRRDRMHSLARNYFGIKRPRSKTDARRQRGRIFARVVARRWETGLAALRTLYELKPTTCFGRLGR